MCEDMTPCTGAAWLMSVVNDGASAGLTSKHQFVRRNVQLTRPGIAPVANNLAKVHLTPSLMPREINTRFVGFWKSFEIAKQALGLSQILFSSILFSDMALSTWSFCLVEGCPNDPFSSVPDV